MIIQMLPSWFRESIEKRLAERGDRPLGPHPSKLIDELVKNYLAPLMKSEGFRKSGQNFWRDSEESIDVLNIQKSQWNDAREASFYINLGTYWKSFHQNQGTEYNSKFPREYDCTVFSRVEEPEEQAWTLQPNSETSRVGVILVGTVQEIAFPWFEKMHTYDGTLNYLRVQGIEDSFERWLASKV